MELYIGGYAQGKREYVERIRKPEQTVLVDELHLWFKTLLSENKNAEEEILQFCEAHPDCILICDEIGCGIVPTDEKDREYRERLGRLLIILAKKADRVERIICGLGQRLK